ncbi:MAG TPA: hypothetical protein VGK67_12975 [Myxococcales bacterium]|jgi:hypothetical protein
MPAKPKPKKKKTSSRKPTVKSLEARVAQVEATVQRLEKLLTPAAWPPSAEPVVPDFVRTARERRRHEDFVRGQNGFWRRTVFGSLGDMKRWEAARGTLSDAKIDERVRGAEHMAAYALNVLWDSGYRLRLHGCKQISRPELAH